MKKIFPIILSFICFFTCKEDDTITTIPESKITFNFAHKWGDTEVTNKEFNKIQYTNSNGEKLSITKLRYLISNISFHKSSGEVTTINGYNLIDVTNNSNMSFTPLTTIPNGSYSKVTFTFGFNNDNNYKNYTDLNSASWNVPEKLGGGYHFMQLEGKYINKATEEIGYAYHAIRAVDISSGTKEFKDTFFEVNLGPVIINKNTVFNVEMNIAEWFNSPNTWDLNVLFQKLMPNSKAQVMISENGQKGVFSLKSIK